MAGSGSIDLADAMGTTQTVFDPEAYQSNVDVVGLGKKLNNIGKGVCHLHHWQWSGTGCLVPRMNATPPARWRCSSRRPRC